MTISFLTLFFGLLSGPLPVEMAVSGPAAAVEVTVDGGAPVRMTAPPWKAKIDFGPALLPHRIVARALDAKGHELARAEEWANLPHPEAKAEIVLEGQKAGPPRAARVVWASSLGETPEATSLTFDGRPLKLDEAGRAVLPAHDLRSLHILAAEVRFSAEKTVRADAAYGGQYGSEVSTELTAVPVRVRSGALPPPKALRGWFTGEGRPLSVAAVEEGPAQLFVVRVPGALEVDRKLGSQGTRPDDFEMRLGKEDSVRFLQSSPNPVAGSDEPRDLFSLSGAYATSEGGLPWLLRGVGANKGAGPEGPAAATQHPEIKRIADAVAVAGLEVTTGNRRRAVLLVLNGDERDASGYDVAAVRRYLAAIRVPFFVWTLSRPAPGSFAASWGAAEDVSAVKNLYRAFEELRGELRAQRIVLVNGRHLPQSVTLGLAARNVELAGGNGSP
ncbi:MAG TPA: hypothetical protein VGQ28_04260 [Thermoanaerobaculia bacterium]|jgi:hypothetical protein|nr:hypothetical protein [Thermoanaerobaculia bacterium]